MAPEVRLNPHQGEAVATFPDADGYIPFADNIDRAARSGVRAIAQPGGSKQDALVTAAADAAGIARLHTGVRLFWH